jgi:hypothetical protein
MNPYNSFVIVNDPILLVALFISLRVYLGVFRPKMEVAIVYSRLLAHYRQVNIVVPVGGIRRAVTHVQVLHLVTHAASGDVQPME